MQHRDITKTELAEIAHFSSATLAKLSVHKPVNMDI